MSRVELYARKLVKQVGAGILTGSGVLALLMFVAGRRDAAAGLLLGAAAGLFNFHLLLQSVGALTATKRGSRTAVKTVAGFLLRFLCAAAVLLLGCAVPWINLFAVAGGLGVSLLAAVILNALGRRKGQSG